MLWARRGRELKTEPSTSEAFSLDEFAYDGEMREPLRETSEQMEIVRLSGWFQLRFRITSALMR